MLIKKLGRSVSHRARWLELSGCNARILKSDSKHEFPPKRGKMFNPRLILCTFLVASSLTMLGQSAMTAATAGPDDESTSAPKLEHFDPNLADKALDPCEDFYKYSCNKWLTANPIPADQVFWSTGSNLQLWNESVLRETMEASSKNEAKRSAVQQKIGDYWAACMDESAIEAAG